jgi:hypothetical protein
MEKTAEKYRSEAGIVAQSGDVFSGKRANKHNSG